MEKSGAISSDMAIPPPVLHTAVLDPVRAEVLVDISAWPLEPGDEIRGKLVGPQCRYASTVEIAYPMLSPNGCGLSPDGKTLYAADTEGARLWAFEVQGPGKLKPKAEFAPHSGKVITGLGGPARFDSLAVMASGNIAVATLTTGYITEISPSGKIVREVKMPDVYPTNICFGGDDMMMAFVTLSATGRIVRSRWSRPGLRLPFQRD